MKDMPPEYGMIFGTRLVSGQMSYTWIGGPVIQLSAESLLHLGVRTRSKTSVVIVIGPYLLKIVTSFGTEIIAVKIDPLTTGDGLLIAKFLFSRWLKSLNSKVLQTLAIWEVIPHEPGAIPEWRDLFRRKKADDGEEVIER
jgi:hypothetical protein